MEAEEQEAFETTADGQLKKPSRLNSDYIDSVVLLLVLLIGVPLNVIALFRLWKQYMATKVSGRGADETRTGYLMLKIQLTVVDLMLLIFYIPPKLLWLYYYEWPFGTVACKGVVYLWMFSHHLMSFAIMIIAIDRAKTVCDLMKMKIKGRMPSPKFKIKCIKVMIILSYIMAAAFSLPQWFVWSSYMFGNWSQCTTMWQAARARDFTEKKEDWKEYCKVMNLVLLHSRPEMVDIIVTLREMACQLYYCNSLDKISFTTLSKQTVLHDASTICHRIRSALQLRTIYRMRKAALPAAIIDRRWRLANDVGGIKFFFQWETIYSIVHLFSMFWIPFLIVIISYACITVSLCYYSSASNNVTVVTQGTQDCDERTQILVENGNKTDDNTTDCEKEQGKIRVMPTWQTTMRTRLCHTSAQVIIAYLVCWLPYNLMQISGYISTELGIFLSVRFDSIFKLFVLFNTLFNPFIYGFNINLCCSKIRPKNNSKLLCCCNRQA